MTASEFQRRYQEYRTFDLAVAIAECERANLEGIDKHTAVVVEFDGLGYCLMLNVAAEEIRCLGIISVDQIHIPDPRPTVRGTCD